MTARVRIKFCGMTRAEDARAAVALGVDALGIVLTRRSKRFVDIEQARLVRSAIAPFVTCVALFMNDEPAWIGEAVAALSPDLLQFHGDEEAAQCACYDRPYLKAVAMGDGAGIVETIDAHPLAAGFLLDAHASGESGGTGAAFDWRRVPQGLRQPLILAGGLTCDNVGSAIRVAQPFAVDVSSGIESAPGIKDAARMRRFVEAVRSGESHAG